MKLQDDAHEFSSAKRNDDSDADLHSWLQGGRHCVSEQTINRNRQRNVAKSGLDLAIKSGDGSEDRFQGRIQGTVNFVPLAIKVH